MSKAGTALLTVLCALLAAPAALAAAPETTIDSGPPDISRNARPSFAFSSPDPGASFECSLDGSPFGPCSSPFTTSPLSQGTYVFRVRAVDGGEEDPTPAERTFTIDRNITGANASAPRVQQVPGRRVSLTVSVTASEHVRAFAAGNVRINKRRSFSFTSPEASIDPGVKRRLVLKPKKPSAGRKIRKALKKGDLTARLSATFTDDTGNRATTGEIDIELKR